MFLIFSFTILVVCLSVNKLLDNFSYDGRPRGYFPRLPVKPIDLILGESYAEWLQGVSSTQLTVARCAQMRYSPV
jgi:hypothetical protein